MSEPEYTDEEIARFKDGGRMNDTGMIVFRDGRPIDLPGCPVPDDETLSRLEKKWEAWARKVPRRLALSLSR